MGENFRVDPTADNPKEGDVLDLEMTSGEQEGEFAVGRIEELDNAPPEEEMSIEDQRERLGQMEQDMATLLVSVEQIGKALGVDLVDFLGGKDAVDV